MSAIVKCDRCGFTRVADGFHVCSPVGAPIRYEPEPDHAAERHRELMLRLAEIQGLLVDILRTMQGVGPQPPR